MVWKLVLPAIVLLAAGAAPLRSAGPAARHLHETSVVELTDTSGHTRSLSDYRGHVVLLNFWATWCLPCREEIPLLVSMQSRFGAQGLQVVGAAADAWSYRERVSAAAEELRINYPVWLGATRAHMSRLGLEASLPATAIMDENGAVVAHIQGPLDAADVEKRLESLLGRKTDHPTRLNPYLGSERAMRAHGLHDHQHLEALWEGAAMVPS